MYDDYIREMHEVDVDGYLARQREASAASSPSSLLTLLLLEDVLFVGRKHISSLFRRNIRHGRRCCGDNIRLTLRMLAAGY